MIRMMLCTDRNGGLGKRGYFPWGKSYFQCLKRFKESTIHDIVIVGRKTFDSLSTLPSSRYNYVISSDGKGPQAGGYVKIDIDTLKSCIDSRDSVFNFNDVWIIGGKSIYEQLFPYVEEIHHSVIVDKDCACDTFMNTKMWENSPDWSLHESISFSDDVVANVWRKK
jgi:dihydrofolate reductase